MQLTRREQATIRAALEYWKEELREGKEWIPDSTFFTNYSPLSEKEVDALAERFESTKVDVSKCHTAKVGARSGTSRSVRTADTERHRVKRLMLMAPTYNANYYTRQVSEGTKPEFGTPYLPVLVHSADGVRIVLGTHQFLDVDAPDITIERQPRAWAIFLHAIGGCDAVGYIYFLDNGRSYLLKERASDPDEAIQVLEHGECVPDIHGDDADNGGR